MHITVPIVLFMLSCTFLLLLHEGKFSKKKYGVGHSFMLVMKVGGLYEKGPGFRRPFWYLIFSRTKEFSYCIWHVKYVQRIFCFYVDLSFISSKSIKLSSLMLIIWKRFLPIQGALICNKHGAYFHKCTCALEKNEYEF